MGRPKIEPPEEIIALLGTLPDSDVAERAGVSVLPVRRWRDERGIPVYRKGQEARDQKQERLVAMHAQTGVTLKAACQVLGINYETGRDWSKSLELKWKSTGRPAKQSSGVKARAAASMSALGSMTLQEIADTLDVTVEGARYLVKKGEGMVASA